MPDVIATKCREFQIDDGHPAAVVVEDLGVDWTFESLNQAFRHVLTGSALVAVQKNRYWRGPDGLTMDAGPFVAALEYASGKHAVTVGKPSPAFFAAAARSLDMPVSQMVMVGDDVTTDVRGAVAAGLRGVLVRTGKFRVEDLELARSDVVIDSVADLPVHILGREPGKRPAAKGWLTCVHDTR